MLNHEAEVASKISRRLNETYSGAMNDFATRRVGGGDQQTPWDAMTKLREEARLNRATERAEEDRRSAPLKKAMDRVLRGGLEPAVPMPFFKADALYKVRACVASVRVCVGHDIHHAVPLSFPRFSLPSFLPSSSESR